MAVASKKKKTKKKKAATSSGKKTKKKFTTKMAATTAASRRTWDEKKRKAVGSRIKTMREKRGLDIADLAEKMDVFVPQVYQLESGKFLPAVPTLVTVCKILKCSTDHILGLKKKN